MSAFTYRGIDIGWSMDGEYWAGTPHFYGDDCRPNGHAKTLREAMDAIDEYFEERE